MPTKEPSMSPCEVVGRSYYVHEGVIVQVVRMRTSYSYTPPPMTAEALQTLDRQRAEYWRSRRGGSHE